MGQRLQWVDTARPRVVQVGPSAEVLQKLSSAHPHGQYARRRRAQGKDGLGGLPRLVPVCPVAAYAPSPFPPHTTEPASLTTVAFTASTLIRYFSSSFNLLRHVSNTVASKDLNDAAEAVSTGHNC